MRTHWMATALAVALLGIVAEANARAQVAHPSMTTDAGVKVYLYEIDIKLSHEDQGLQEERGRKINQWVANGVIKSVAYESARATVNIGPKFHALSESAKRDVASTVAAYARRNATTSRFVHLVDPAGKHLGVFSLEMGLTWD